MWKIIVLILGIFLTFALITYSRKHTSVQEQEDTFYYKVVDQDGKISSNHDSGIKPSLIGQTKVITIPILKTEFNDGIALTLNGIAYLMVGTRYDTLDWKIIPESVTEDNGLYNVVIRVP